MAEGVVDLKAQYGIDTDNNGRITEAPNEWMKAAPADWTRVRAIRVALLVSSRNFEKPPASAAGGPPGWPRQPGLVGRQLRDDERRRHARLGRLSATPTTGATTATASTSSVIPLRNMVWDTDS